ncbi:hypothetical protein MACK_002081 [Theileria orientalis]|uniref:Endoplasmic reticulum oxidoreductin n=1 Tax=Theileria orientalis TaxID=68886 RepID=A0A976MB35_THEOR|nr:hypothetical protein MACK_002081 [Theileria orientalis]
MFHRKRLYILAISYFLINCGIALSSAVLNNQNPPYSNKFKDYHSENVTESQMNGIVDEKSPELNFNYDVDRGDIFSLPQLVSQAETVHSKLKLILSDYYFRIYRVNLDSKCSSRPHSNSCSSQKNFISLNKANTRQNNNDNQNGSNCNVNSRENGSGIQKCYVDRCNSTDIPFNIMHSKKENYVLRFPEGSVTKRFPNLDFPELFEKGDSSQENFVYVDLLRNPPSYTGYNGRDDWKEIHSEISRFENISCRQSVHIYKLISGMEANIEAFSSINYECVNPAEAYEKQVALPEYQSNYQFYVNKLSKRPDRIENIYYTYKYVLAAMVRLESYLASYNVNLQLVNNQLYLHMDDFIKYLNKQSCTTSCDCRFTRHEGYLKKEDEDCCKIIDSSCGAEVLNKLDRVIQMVECVDCEKCRLHGKIKASTLLMAIRILSTPHDKLSELELDRNDLVALLHGFDYFTQSVLIVQKFERHKKRQIMLYPLRFLLGLLLIIIVLYRREIFSFRHKKQSTNPEKAK